MTIASVLYRGKHRSCGHQSGQRGPRWRWGLEEGLNDRVSSRAEQWRDLLHLLVKVIALARRLREAIRERSGKEGWGRLMSHHCGDDRWQQSFPNPTQTAFAMTLASSLAAGTAPLLWRVGAPGDFPHWRVAVCLGLSGGRKMLNFLSFDCKVPHTCFYGVRKYNAMGRGWGGDCGTAREPQLLPASALASIYQCTGVFSPFFGVWFYQAIH